MNKDAEEPLKRIKDRDGTIYRLVVFKVLEVYDELPPVGDMPVPAEVLFVDEPDRLECPKTCRLFRAYVPESVFGEAAT